MCVVRAGTIQLHNCNVYMHGTGTLRSYHIVVNPCRPISCRPITLSTNQLSVAEPLDVGASPNPVQGTVSSSARNIIRREWRRNIGNSGNNNREPPNKMEPPLHMVANGKEGAPQPTTDWSTRVTHNNIVCNQYRSGYHCTGALYTFSYTVSTNRSWLRSPSSRPGNSTQRPKLLGCRERRDVGGRELSATGSCDWSTRYN